MKVTTTIRTAGATAIAGLALVTLSALPAGAATPDPGARLEAGRAKCDAAIDRRLSTLDELSTRIGESKHLTDADRASLSDDVTTTRNGLTSLKSQIDADSDAATLRADCKRIVTDYRVYLLVAPTVHLVNGADAALSAVENFGDANAKLTDAIAAAEGRGVDAAKVADAKAKQADMNAKVADAQAKAAPVAGTVVPLTPADINAGTGQAVLTSARSDLQAAKQSLQAARADLGAAVADLR